MYVYIYTYTHTHGFTPQDLGTDRDIDRHRDSDR